MASPAEQLASSINFSALSKATELKRSGSCSRSALCSSIGSAPTCRCRASIRSSPGVLPGQSNGILGLLDMFAGGAVSRMSIFALNIMPYISASIIVQLLSSVSPKLEALKKEGESGRKKLNQYTRMGTVVLAALQAFGVAKGLVAKLVGPRSRRLAVLHGEHGRHADGGHRIPDVAGRAITSRGVGNGTSLIIFAGIVARLPFALNKHAQSGQDGRPRRHLGVRPPGHGGGGHHLHRLHGALRAADCKLPRSCACDCRFGNCTTSPPLGAFHEDDEGDDRHRHDQEGEHPDDVEVARLDLIERAVQGEGQARDDAAKMMSDVPLPTAPARDLLASHIRNTVPAVSVDDRVAMKNGEATRTRPDELATIPSPPRRPAARPAPPVPMRVY